VATATAWGRGFLGQESPSPERCALSPSPKNSGLRSRCSGGAGKVVARGAGAACAEPWRRGAPAAHARRTRFRAIPAERHGGRGRRQGGGRAVARGRLAHATPAASQRSARASPVASRTCPALRADHARAVAHIVRPRADGDGGEERLHAGRVTATAGRRGSGRSRSMPRALLPVGRAARRAADGDGSRPSADTPARAPGSQRQQPELQRRPGGDVRRTAARSWLRGSLRERPEDCCAVLVAGFASRTPGPRTRSALFSQARWLERRWRGPSGEGTKARW